MRFQGKWPPQIWRDRGAKRHSWVLLTRSRSCWNHKLAEAWKGRFWYVSATECETPEATGLRAGVPRLLPSDDTPGSQGEDPRRFSSWLCGAGNTPVAILRKATRPGQEMLGVIHSSPLSLSAALEEGKRYSSRRGKGASGKETGNAGGGKKSRAAGQKTPGRRSQGLQHAGADGRHRGSRKP